MNHAPLESSRAARISSPPASSRSYASSASGASVHHSATVRQGPALATTLPPSAPSPITRSGAPDSSHRTSAVRGGRSARAASDSSQEGGTGRAGGGGGANLPHPAANGAQRSGARGLPTRSGPTSAES